MFQLNIVERGKVIRAERAKERFRQHEEFMTRNRNSRFRSYSNAVIFLIVESRTTFLSQIFTLLFDFTYGLAQTVILRGSTPIQGISGSQNTMGFGQLVPLLFLLLPCLTIFELYSGK